jgi:hypothetical protein
MLSVDIRSLEEEYTNDGAAEDSLGAKIGGQSSKGRGQSSHISDERRYSGRFCRDQLRFCRVGV